VASISAAATVVIVILVGLGAGQGPLVLMLGVLGGLGTFALSLWGILKPLGTRQRLVFGVAVSGFVLLLVLIGFATRAISPLPPLTGTQDVAVVGVLSDQVDSQPDFDAAAARLADTLEIPSGSVRDYTPMIDRPPLAELPTDGTATLDEWATDFVGRSQAELLLGGYAQALPSGQMTLHLGLYISPALTVDAPEIAGWYRLDPILLERSPASTTEQARLQRHIQLSLGGVAEFLSGLDAWHSGDGREAIQHFTQVLDTAPTPPERLLTGLAYLLRGHAQQMIATAASTSEDRLAALQSARRDYDTAAAIDELAARVAVSIGLTTYLEIADACEQGTAPPAQLDEATRRFQSVIDDPSSSDLLRWKAQVNLAQVEQCRAQSGTTDDTTLEELLQPLLTLDTDVPGPERQVRRQIKALAFSIHAVGLDQDDRYGDAVDALDQALALETRSDRQATWNTLRAYWLLKDCRLAEAIDSRDEALRQYSSAVDRGRLPPDEAAQVLAGFDDAVRDYTERCDAHSTEGSDL